MRASSSRAFAKRAARFFKEELGDKLLNAYLIGSLAHGGYSPLYSDIDLALILSAPLDARKMRTLIARAKSLDARAGPRLSVFWSDTRFGCGRFPVLDQADFIDHGIPIFPGPKPRAARPSLRAVRRYLLGHPVDYWTRMTKRFARTARVRAGDFKELLRCVLYPARLILTWETGRIASNDEAVERLSGRRPRELALDGLRAALACRHGKPEPAKLVPYIKTLKRQRELTLAYLAGSDE